MAHFVANFTESVLLNVPKKDLKKAGMHFKHTILAFPIFRVKMRVD